MPRLYCPGCYGGLDPMLGAAEVVLDARLGTRRLPTGQRVRYCLSAVTIAAASGSDEDSPA